MIKQHHSGKRTIFWFENFHNLWAIHYGNCIKSKTSSLFIAKIRIFPQLLNKKSKPDSSSEIILRFTERTVSCKHMPL